MNLQEYIDILRDTGYEITLKLEKTKDDRLTGWEVLKVSYKQFDIHCEYKFISDQANKHNGGRKAYLYKAIDCCIEQLKKLAIKKMTVNLTKDGKWDSKYTWTDICE